MSTLPVSVVLLSKKDDIEATSELDSEYTAKKDTIKTLTSITL